MSAPPSASPDPLRLFLRDRMPPQQILRVASANYGVERDSIAEEFQYNLDTGRYDYRGEGNMYECALMQVHDMTAQRPLNMLFGAWWMGTFCSSPGYFVLIDNLSGGGVDQLLNMVVDGCQGLGEDSRKAAKAAIPFIQFLHPLTPFADEQMFNATVKKLDAIARNGAVGRNAS